MHTHTKAEENLQLARTKQEPKQTKVMHVSEVSKTTRRRYKIGGRPKGKRGVHHAGPSKATGRCCEAMCYQHSIRHDVHNGVQWSSDVWYKQGFAKTTLQNTMGGRFKSQGLRILTPSAPTNKQVLRKPCEKISDTTARLSEMSCIRLCRKFFKQKYRWQSYFY